MIELKRKLKNVGPLETLVLSSLAYVVIMLVWTASTRSTVVQKANDIKSNHKTVVEFINNQVNECSSNVEVLLHGATIVIQLGYPQKLLNIC